MNKPLLLRLTPFRIRQSLTSRVYLGKYDKYRSLYGVSRLEFCPHIRMFDLNPGDIISGHIAFNGFHELELSREVAVLSRQGNFFVDVGANMGYFSLLWAGLNPRNRVMAFEASLSNVKKFEKNILQNGLTDQITIIPKAAGHKAGTIHFNLGPLDQTGWGGISNEKSANTVEMPIVRLDEELHDCLIDVLKIDVEGADTWVLYGCENLLKKRLIRKIFFEQNITRMAELGIGENDARDFLIGLGYRCIPFNRTGDEWVAYPSEEQCAHQGWGAT